MAKNKIGGDHGGKTTRKAERIRRNLWMQIHYTWQEKAGLSAKTPIGMFGIGLTTVCLTMTVLGLLGHITGTDQKSLCCNSDLSGLSVRSDFRPVSYSRFLVFPSKEMV